MAKPSPFDEQERADLVAYLDGELTGEPARALERKLSLHPEARAEADALRRAWELLDYLPRPEPSGDFTHRTLSRVAVRTDRLHPDARPRRAWLAAALGVAWAAAVALAAWGGFAGYQRLAPPPAAPREDDPALLRDLRLAENLRYYELVNDLEFLRELDQPDLFGEETAAW